jgi:hypothetical protein
MNQNVELRYYEILFQRLVLKFHQHYTLGRLSNFLEILAYVSEVNITSITMATQRIITYDVLIRYTKGEYAMCLILCAGYTKNKVRKIVECSPNTMVEYIQDYEDGKLDIVPRFGLDTSHNIRKLMKGFHDLANII